LAPPATHPPFTDAVSVELGTSEFHDGDTIVITEVRETKATRFGMARRRASVPGSPFMIAETAFVSRT
jgi:hypothetical protein